MKTKFTLLFIGFILTVSCSDVLSDYELSEYDCQMQAIEIVELGYLTFVDQQYQLDLDLIDAIALGYSSKAYEMLVAKIDEFNEVITEELNHWRIDKNISEVRISDATYSKFKDEPFNYETKEVSINGVIEVMIIPHMKKLICCHQSRHHQLLRIVLQEIIHLGEVLSQLYKVRL